MKVIKAGANTEKVCGLAAKALLDYVKRKTVGESCLSTRYDGYTGSFLQDLSYEEDFVFDISLIGNYGSKP